MKKEQPPVWVNSLLDRLAPPDLVEEIKGDLYEMFREDITQKRPRAKFNYAINGLGFLTKHFFWKKRTNYSTSFIMLKSYFKMARRSLFTYRSNTVINVLGLVIGMASALVIFSVIRFESSFDSFHTDADNIYRIVRVTGTGMKITESSELRTGVSFPVPDAFKQEATSINSITSVLFIGGALVEIPDASGAIVRRFNETNSCALVEPSFFSMFDFKGTGFKWISGSPKKSLEKPFSVVLTTSASKKFFPDGNAMGKTLKIDKRNDCTVTGIIEDFPANSDFPFTVLASYSTLRVLAPKMMDDWSSVDDSHCAFVVPNKGFSVAKIEEEMAKIHKKHASFLTERFYMLQPMKEMHFDARFGNYNGRTITHNTVQALGIIALFLLLTGCINYINLATAQSTARSKEIGLRKVMGSNRVHLVAQFLIETFLVVLIAGVLALGLSELILINLQFLLSIKPSAYHFADPVLLGALLVSVIAVTFFSGLYPAIKISSFSPVTSLKNKFITEAVGGFNLRRVLVTAQFGITQVLVICTFVVVIQMRFFQNTDVGFAHKAVVNVSIPQRDPVKRATLEQQFRSQSFVSGVSASFTLPGGASRNRNYQGIATADTPPDKEVVFEYQSIDTAFLNLYKIKLLAGRNFHQVDSSHYLLLNKTLMKNLLLGNPEEAVGKPVLRNGEKYTVIGIVDDFYSNSLKNGVDNLAIEMNPNAYRTLSIKLMIGNDKGSITEAMAEVEKLWKATYPEFIFDYEFLDENIKAFYTQEQKYTQLFEMFSTIFMLIGCLGLFGLITFVVNRKQKELAVRKVMGASVPSLLLLFSKEYIWLVLISFALATPIAYYIANEWLNNFAFHVDLQWWLFATPGVMVLVVAVVVVCAKSLGAANKNPVESLKYE
ncbi:MAG TPA: ABC transporter permease [Cyclobacteriaceae bacterium]|nr:ABC transporter permease [Cyclobacteriaceae bacterium]